jgi:hypothetical protein
MAEKLPKITKREALRECFVPFTADDTRREELLEIITTQGKNVDALDKEIDKLKSSKKPLEEEYEKALTELKKGKPEQTGCWEFFYWSDRKIIVRRQDNEEIVSEETITEDAVPLTMGDEVVVE